MLRNNFLFENTLALYDYLLLRNQEIINNKEIDLNDFLSGSFDIIEANYKHIHKVYQNYVEDAIRHEYASVELSDVLKRVQLKKEIKEAIESIGSIFSLTNTQPLMRLKSRSRGNMIGALRAGAESQQSRQSKSIKKFDFKVISLNTVVKDADINGVHKFYNMLEGLELDTKAYKVVRLRILLILFLQSILSNWHYICYLTMGLFTFVNGGINGFFYSGALIMFVLVEENLPELVFWRMCFFNTVIGFSLKLMFTVFADKLVEAQIIRSEVKSYIHNISFLIIGSSSYVFEIFIMIFILIELILLDELGFKKKKMIDFEDSNTAYIRMKINKVFTLRDNEKFHVYTQYLRALFQSIVETESEVDTLKRVITKKKKKSISPVQKTSKQDKYNEDIDINEVIEYERHENAKKADLLRETIKGIEKNIFIKSFGKFSEENTKSFRWQLFSVYNRKPGIDLSPLLNFLLMCILIYTMVFIDKMSGGTQSFADQVVAASIVNQSLIWTLVLGIMFMIIERMIYKRNPKAWREYFQYQDKKTQHPLTIGQLDFCLRKAIKDGKNPATLKFEHLEYDEQAHMHEIAEKLNKEKKSKVSVKKKHDDSHMKNPLVYRYWFLIIITIMITFLCGIYLPIEYTRLRVNPNLFSIEEFKTGTGTNTSKSFVYFQNYMLYQCFYAIFMSYLIVSALQIRLGEPINKGRRELLSRFNILYKTINIAIRSIPFFFTITIVIDFMLTSTSLDIWEWFKFESIYEALYLNIMEIKSRAYHVPGLKLPFLTKFPLGSILAFVQIFLLICPFIFFGKYSSEKNKVELVTLNVDLITGNSQYTLYSGLSASSIRDMGSVI